MYKELFRCACVCCFLCKNVFKSDGKFSPHTVNFVEVSKTHDCALVNIHDLTNLSNALSTFLVISNIKLKRTTINK